MEQIDLLNNEDNIDIKRIKALRKEIKKHNKAYYEEDKPTISDFEYDKLIQELRKLESMYPDVEDEYKLKENIGGTKKDIFTDVVHTVPMQSLQDVFNFEDVISFLSKIRNEYGDKVEFIVETKIDGLSVSLEYVDGKLVRGSTRGDGLVGEDVTENIKCIESIPETLTSKDTIEVRGEVYLPRKEFERINLELEVQGKKLLANPRNTAAGTLRQLNTDLVRARKLDIFVFNIQKSETKEFTKHSESLAYCKALGIHTLDYTKTCITDEEVLNAINEIGNLRDNLEYDIDGAVIKINDLKLRDNLGTTVKVPKWAVAYKYPPEQKTTKILNVIMQVGRTGKVTPMAVLEPVRVAGSMIASATLHNFDYIKQKDIRIGDMCIIQKAGDVIPEIDRIIPESRNGSEIEIIKPTECPVCKEALEETTDIVDIRCVNLECPSLVYRSILHFSSRDCMDIRGLGDSITEKLIDNNKIEDVADIYYLKLEDFLELENFKDKSANNLINAINATKNNSLDKLIFGLGIRNIGKKAAKVLAENFEDIYEIINADVEKLNSLDDFGAIMAESVYNYFKKEKTLEIIEKLAKAEVNLKGSKKELTSDKLLNLTFCITGSFENYSRDEITKLIEENGGKAVTSVSKKTSYLVAGEEAGSKLTKAEELKVNIISIEQLNDMIK